MLSNVVKFHAVGILVLIINLGVIYVIHNLIFKIFVKPLLKSTAYALLVACDVDKDYKH